jgi:hypothetical protein
MSPLEGEPLEGRVFGVGGWAVSFGSVSAIATARTRLSAASTRRDRGREGLRPFPVRDPCLLERGHWIRRRTTSIPVTCSGTLAGLGNEDLNLHLSVSGFALYQCQNGGGNTAPGQNKVLAGPATSDTAIPASAIKNGNLTFTTNPATLTTAPTVSGATAGCPNPNWTGVNPVLTLTDITLDIFQPVTTRIFHCTASDPNGLTSPVTLSC